VINKARLLQTFTDLLKINSPSLNEGGVAKYIAARLRKTNIDFYRDQSYKKFGGKCGNIYAKTKGRKGALPLLFVSHTDTVVETRRLKIVNEGDMIRSDGKTILGADNKAGVAVMLELMESIARKRDIGKVEFLFTVAEEVGLLGAKHFDCGKLGAQYAYVIDSGLPVGTIVTSSPSAAKITATVLGKAAHAGAEPEEGVSAIQIAAKAINRMRLGRIDHETTANIGVISGGKKTNIIPARARIEGETRSFSEIKLEKQIVHMHECFNLSAERFGGKIKFAWEKSFDTYQIPPEAPIVKLIRKAARSLKISTQTRSSGGGSDANIFNEKGIQAVVLGQGYNGAHSEQECITNQSLFQMATLLEALVMQAVGKKK